MEAVFDARQRRLANVQSLINRSMKVENDIRRLLNKRPAESRIIDGNFTRPVSIGVIGRPNCGKTSLINELLCQDLIPVSDTACLSRIVSVKFSEVPYVRVLHKDGTEVAGSKTLLDIHTPESLQRHITRESSERLLDKMAEVGLNHPLLKLGVEFLDLPAIENLETTQELMEIVHNGRYMPVLVYLIDGNMSLRAEDLHTIQYFRETYPQLQLLYAGNKMEEDCRAADMDEPSDSDSDSEAVDVDQVSLSLASTDLSEKKFALVEEGLRNNNIPISESLSGGFHGLSMHRVKQARRESKPNAGDKFLSNFEVFKGTLADFVDQACRRDIKEAIIRLRSELVCHRLVSSHGPVSVGKLDEHQAKLTSSREEIKTAMVRFLDSVKPVLQGEKREIQSLLSDINRKTSEKVRAVVDDVLAIVPASAAAIHLKILISDVKNYIESGLHESPDHFQRYLEYLSLGYELRNRIINSIIDESSRLDTFASKVLSHVKDKLHVLNQAVTGLKHFGMDGKDLEVLTAFEILNLSFLRRIRRAILQELMKVFDTEKMVDVTLTPYKTNAAKAPSVDDANSFLDVLMAKLDAGRFSDVVLNKSTVEIETYVRAVEKGLHLLMSVTEGVVLELQKTTTIFSLMISQLAQVEVESRSAVFEVEHGPMVLGGMTSKGKHSQVFLCVDQWNPKDGSEYIVRAVTASDSGRWSETIKSIYYSGLLKPSENLLRVSSWWLPNPETLYMVMQKVQGRLDEANISPDRHITLALDLAKGLKSIHSCGVIFNNVKPQSIMVTSSQRGLINIAKGNFQVLRKENAVVDIEALGRLLLWLCGGEFGASAGTTTRPPSCSGALWGVIQACFKADMTADQLISMSVR